MIFCRGYLQQEKYIQCKLRLGEEQEKNYVRLRLPTGPASPPSGSALFEPPGDVAVFSRLGGAGDNLDERRSSAGLGVRRFRDFG